MCHAMKKSFKALDTSHMVTPKTRNIVSFTIKRWEERGRGDNLETVGGAKEVIVK